MNLHRSLNSSCRVLLAPIVLAATFMNPVWAGQEPMSVAGTAPDAIDLAPTLRPRSVPPETPPAPAADSLEPHLEHRLNWLLDLNQQDDEARSRVHARHHSGHPNRRARSVSCSGEAALSRA